MAQYRDLLAEDTARSIRVAGMRAIEKRSTLRDPTKEFLSAIGGEPTASGSRVNDLSAISLPVVMACVGILSDMVGVIPCKLYRKTADGREEADDHPASKLITASPNGHHTSFEFRRFVQTGVGFGGNGYGRVYRDAFYDPAEIQPLKPCDVRPEQLLDRSIIYHVKGERTPLTRADIIHVPGLSTDGVMGISQVRALRESIGMAITQREQAGRVFANGARPSMYLKTDKQLSPDQLKAAKEAWEKGYSGTLNAGRTPLFDSGWSLNAIQGMSLQDAEFLASRRFEVEEIARAYRVPLFLLNSTQSSTTWGSGLEQMNQGFLNYCLNPWLVCWEQALGITLLTTQEISQGYYFKFNRGALLQAALESQANFFQAMRNIGVYSINDVRRKLEENDLPDNIGDDYARPFNGQGGVAPSVKVPAQADQQGSNQ